MVVTGIENFRRGTRIRTCNWKWLLQDIIKYVNTIFAQYKVKCVIYYIKYVYLCRFDEVSTIRKPKLITFSITGSKIFFAGFVIYTKNERKTSYQFTTLPHGT